TSRARWTRRFPPWTRTTRSTTSTETSRAAVRRCWWRVVASRRLCSPARTSSSTSRTTEVPGSAGLTLAPLTEDERKAFFREEIANYADQQIRDAGWQPGGALDRARREFTPVLTREYDEGLAAGDRLWSANVLDGGSVGW